MFSACMHAKFTAPTRIDGATPTSPTSIDLTTATSGRRPADALVQGAGVIAGKRVASIASIGGHNQADKQAVSVRRERATPKPSSGWAGWVLGESAEWYSTCWLSPRSCPLGCLSCLSRALPVIPSLLASGWRHGVVRALSWRGRPAAARTEPRQAAQRGLATTSCVA